MVRRPKSPFSGHGSTTTGGAVTSTSHRGRCGPDRIPLPRTAISFTAPAAPGRPKDRRCRPPHRHPGPPHRSRSPGIRSAPVNSKRERQRSSLERTMELLEREANAFVRNLYPRTPAEAANRQHGTALSGSHYPVGADLYPHFPAEAPIMDTNRLLSRASPLSRMVENQSSVRAGGGRPHLWPTRIAPPATHRLSCPQPNRKQTWTPI